MKTVLMMPFLLLVCLPTWSVAVEGCRSGDCARCHTLTVKEAGDFLQNAAEVKNVTVSPIKGMWQIQVEKDGRSGLLLMNFGKSYVVPVTRIVPIGPTAAVNDALAPSAQSPKVAVAAIPLTDSVIMGNPKGKKHLFVFTDPDCPYCVRFHAELKKLIALDPDVTIYIKLFPLRMHPQAFDKSRVILGSRSLELLEKAFAKEPLPIPGENDRKEPVDETLRLGEKLGINGTPTVVLQDGTLLIGGNNAESLKKMLDKSAGASANEKASVGK
jgi:thiol:disulfide interchange protein DsbC